MHTSNRSVSCPWSNRVSVTSRTAVYGPVCTVVWEGRSREAPPYPDQNLFYVLAFVPRDKENQFFILTQADAQREIQENIERARARQIAKGRTGEKAGTMPGISWDAASRYKALWNETLPA